MPKLQSFLAQKDLKPGRVPLSPMTDKLGPACGITCGEAWLTLLDDSHCKRLRIFSENLLMLLDYEDFESWIDQATEVVPE